MSLPTTNETTFFRGSKTRKKRGGLHGSMLASLDKQSIRDPKVFAQLIKNSKKHNIPLLMKELKEDFHNGIGFPNHNSAPNSHPTPYSSDIKHEKISHIEVPKEIEDAFIADFQQFVHLHNQHLLINGIENIRKLDESFHSHPENLQLLSRLYYLCEQNYYEANALQLWTDLKRYFSSQQLRIMNDDPKAFYKHHLFHYDRFSKVRMFTQDLTETLKLRPDSLVDPCIKLASNIRKTQLSTSFFDEVAKPQCVLLKGFVNLLGIDSGLFCIGNIIKNHPDQLINVTLQNPDIYGLAFDPALASNGNIEMKIKNYGEYQRESMNNIPQNIRDQNGMIKSALNIDITNWKQHIDHLTAQIPAQFLFKSNYDTLSFFKSEIKGLTNPQIQLKVEGSWTGLHEEHLRLRSVNLNHGPYTCLWYAIGGDQIPKFQQLVQNYYKIDICKDQGSFFPDIDFCIKNGIKLHYFAQEPGDIVLLGPGSWHWVKCSGVTMSTSWNYLGKDIMQFDQAFKRQEINRILNIKSLLPVRYLALQVLLNDTLSLSKELAKFLALNLAKFYQGELVNYNRFSQEHPECIFLKPNQQEDVHQCSLCNSEILNFYAHCPACTSLKNKNSPVITCLNCYEEHTKDCANTTRKLITHFKLSEKVVKLFVSILIHIDVELDTMRQNKETLAMRLQRIESEDKNNHTLSLNQHINKKIGAISPIQHQQNYQNHLPQFQIPPIQIPKLNLQDIIEPPQQQQQPVAYVIPTLSQTIAQVPSLGGQPMEEEKLSTFLPHNNPVNGSLFPPQRNSPANANHQHFDLSSLLNLRLPPNPEELFERHPPAAIVPHHHHKIPEFTGFEPLMPIENQMNNLEAFKEDENVQFLKDFLVSSLEPPTTKIEIEKEEEEEEEEKVPKTKEKPKKKRKSRKKKQPEPEPESEQNHEEIPQPSQEKLDKIVQKLLENKKRIFIIKREPAAPVYAEAEVEVETQEQAQKQAYEQAQALARAQAEAQAKAQAEALAKAEAEAQALAFALAQAQAQALAQAQAQAQAEAEAQARAQALALALAQAQVKPEETPKKRRRRRKTTTEEKTAEKTAEKMKEETASEKKPEKIEASTNGEVVKKKRIRRTKEQIEAEEIASGKKSRRTKPQVDTNGEVVIKKRIRRTREQLEADPNFRSRSKFKDDPSLQSRSKPKEKPETPKEEIKSPEPPQTATVNHIHHNPIEENLTSLNIKRPAEMFTESDLTSFETIKKQPKIYNLLNQEDGSPIEATPMMRPMTMGMDFASMEPEEIGWGLEEPETSGFEMEQTGQMEEGFAIPRLNLESIRHNMNMNMNLNPNNIMNMNMGNILPFSIPQFPDNNGFNQM